MDQNQTSVTAEGTIRDDYHQNQPSVEGRKHKPAGKEDERELEYAAAIDPDTNQRELKSRDAYEDGSDQSNLTAGKVKLESLTGMKSAISASDNYRQEREAAKIASEHLQHAPAVDPDLNLEDSRPSSSYKNDIEELNFASQKPPSESVSTTKSVFAANDTIQANKNVRARQRESAIVPNTEQENIESAELKSIASVNPGAVHISGSLCTSNNSFTPIQPSVPGAEKPWTYVVAHAVTESKDTERGEGEGEVVIAEQMPESLESSKICGISRKTFFFVLLVSVAIIVVGYIFFHLLFFRGRPTIQTFKPTAPPTTETPKTHIFNGLVLKTAKERGFLRCFAGDEVFEDKGFTLDMCYAIAAAIFDDPTGTSDRVEFIDMPFGEQFGALWDGTIDVSTAFTTHNMQRDIFEPSTGLPMSFSTPFLHSGMLFIGIPEFVDCADRLDSLKGVCRGLSVCVQEKTTHADIVDSILPGITVHHLQSQLHLSESFVNGTCNVIAGELLLWKSIGVQVIELGYRGELGIGTKLHSFEPLAITTKGDDEEWAHFCNWILQALITAEAVNITQEVASSPSLWWSLTTASWGEKFPDTTSIFGDDYKNMFRNAIAAVGHYGEVYERSFEQDFPRDGAGRLNSINVGDTGLLYPYPFGMLTVDDSDASSTNSPHPSPISNGTLESIDDRGVLRCGVIGNQTIFAKLQVDVDNETTAIENNKQWTGIDVEYCRAISSAIFPDIILNVNHQDGRVVFVDVGTSVQDGYIALDNDEIDVFAGGSISLTADIKETMTGKGYTFTPPYYYYHHDNDVQNNSIQYSIEIGRSLVTRDMDKQWSSFVRWITTAIVYADQQEIAHVDALDMPVVELFGPEFKQMFRDVILTIGNYGEVFHRTMTEPYNISRTGRNLVNTDGGPQFVALSLL